MIPVRCSHFLVVLLLALSSQLTGQADSLFQLLPTLPDAEQVDQTNEYFYQLYTTDFAKATKQAERALAIAETQNWVDRQALTLKNLGVVNYLQGNYEAALEYYQLSADTYAAIGDYAGQGAVYNEMGVFFKKRKELARALEYLDRAFQLCEKADDAYCVAVALDNRGTIFLDKENYTHADSIFREVVSLRQTIKDSVGLSYVYNNLSASAVEQGKVENAMYYLLLSTDIRRSLNDRQGVAININNIGEVLLSADRPREAIPFFEESLEESRALKFTDLERHTMQMLADANKGIGNYEAALDWQSKSHKLRDSLFTETSSRQIAEMQEKYETAEKEQILVRQKSQLRNRNLTLYGAVGVLVLLSIIAFQLWQQYRQVKREKQLQEKLLRQESENELQQERLRISRDLHDNLGAELTLISSALAQKAYRAKAIEEQQSLNSIGENARRAMDELRGTIWAIRGEGDTAESLALRLRDFANRFEHSEINIEVFPEVGELPLMPTRTLNLYRIAQEAIHNAVKYAPNSKIAVAFRQMGEQLQLTIEDQGPGFNPTTTARGYGLHNMQERAAEMKGTCNIQSTGKGTQVLVQVPIAR